ncbi:hypothetical protein X777_06472 [Ooceraea biroi]|uniref:Uncharacterized protein n=1 Tax=Ooceraea biroi TaxID=2015173 RepID=A0A026WCI5_OOCBI|nr:hypothetical protein X777_06472 [Ooceraea biroi]
MENCVVNETFNNDFLSQSYSQGIERITGTKEHITDFQLPKELLEFREEVWRNLFDKYMEEMSDEIEVNVDTLEPDPDEDQEDEENDEQFSSIECKSGQRAPMRKPACLVQYWIDTGNPPYKMLLNRGETSEAGSSLSEKETAPTDISSLSTIVNGNASNIVNSCNKRNSESSCSSVDTAVYILSNANVTKKADTIAIIKGAKGADKFSRGFVKATNVLSNGKIMCIGTMRGDGVACNNSNADAPRNTVAERAASEPHSQWVTDTVMTSDAVEPSQDSCCEEIDRNDTSHAHQSLDDIASIFEHFDKTSKRLSQDAKTDDTASDDEVLGKDGSRGEQASANDITKNVSYQNDAKLTLLHRKKLYTGRNSPVDLILTKKHSMNRVSEGRKTLHPALDTESTTNNKLPLAHKGKNKLSRQRNSKTRKSARGRRKRSTSNKKTANIDTDNIRDKVVTNGIQNSTIDTSFNSASDFHNDSRVGRDVSLRNDDSPNISIINKPLVQDLASLNLNPVVQLERITSSFTRDTCDSIKNNTQKRVDTSRKLYTCNVENLDLETIDSDESTILICECKKNKHHISSSNQHFLYSFVEDDSTSDARKDDKKDKLSSLQTLESTDIKLKKKVLVVLKQLPPSQYHKNCTTEKPQDLNVSGVTCQKVMLDTSTMHSYSLRDILNKRNNVKLPEVKIVLKRLPTNLYVEKSSNVNSTSNSADKRNISRNISTRRKKRKRKSRIRTNISVCENVRTRSSVRTTRKVDYNYSLDTSNAISKQENQTLDKIESNSISQHESRVNQFERSNYSILSSISSDEDDFIQLIQGTRKKLKTSTDDEASKAKLVERNSHEKTKLVSKNKNYFTKHTSLVIHSSRKLPSKKTNRLINKKNRFSRIKTKSSSDSASTDSLQTNKSEIFSVLPSKTDNNNSASNSDKRGKRQVSFLNFNTGDIEKLMNSSIISRNKIDYKDDNCVVLFQTKTFDTDSSDSERSNSHAVKSHRKIATEINNPTRRSSRYYNHTNKKNFLDDSVTKKYNQTYSDPLNSSTNRMRDIITRSTSVASEKANVNKRFANGKFNDSINSETSTVRNKQIFEKFKRSAIQQEDAKSVTKLLTFQTKSYYDSDSS